MGELANKRHERFCQEYMVDLNATRAYIRTGYSVKNADNCSSALLGNPKVRARIEALQAEVSKRTGVSQDRVIRELARVAFLDPTQLADMNSATVRTDANEDNRAAIASVKVKSGADFTEREVRFADKLKALELLGRHLGMFQDNMNLSVEMPTIVNDVPQAPNG